MGPLRARAHATGRAVRTGRECACRRSQVSAALEDPHHYALVQEWDSLQALRDHVGSQAFHDLQRRLTGMTKRWQLDVHLVRTTLGCSTNPCRDATTALVEVMPVTAHNRPPLTCGRFALGFRVQAARR
jgi:quinol monooxygenase YgiN